MKKGWLECVGSESRMLARRHCKSAAGANEWMERELPLSVSLFLCPKCAAHNSSLPLLTEAVAERRIQVQGNGYPRAGPSKSLQSRRVYFHQTSKRGLYL